MKKIFLIVCLLVSSASFADNREVIVVTAEQRDLLLSEMRNMLASSQKILQGVLDNDMEKVEKAARKSGMKMARDTPASLRKILPAGFKKLGPLTHKGFERIANEADAFGDTHKILKNLAELQRSCISCHQSYQIKVVN